MAAQDLKKPVKRPRKSLNRAPSLSPRGTSGGPDAGDFSVFFLDMGRERYGDCMILRMGDKTIMIDGAHPKDYVAGRWPDHPSIPEQLAKILNAEAPFNLSLLVVTHAHSDHIGCLPTLIGQGTIKPEFALVCDPDLGWGRVGGAEPDAGVSETALRMAAALREESRVDESDSALLQDFLDDAASLEPGYRKMLEDLKAMGTQVARFGADDAGVKAIVTAFADTGMEILGPTQEQLELCANRIHDAARETQRGSDAFINSRPDAAVDEVQLYKILAAARADSADAAPSGSSGPCINDQSIVLKFDFQGKTLFFSGDMQLSDPQFSGVSGDMEGLRKTIAGSAPYSLVKFPHHGSFNGINEEIFAAFKSKFFGLCAGIGDLGHPSKQALSILKEHADGLTWARTDKNGLVRFQSKGDSWEVEVSDGSLNDDSPNSPQDAAPESPAEAPAELQSSTSTASDAEDVIHVTARVPKRATRVTVTVDLQPQEVAARRPFLVAPSKSRERDSGAIIAGGRAVPKLLFVTNGQALRRSVGNSSGDVDTLLSALRGKGHTVFEDLAGGAAADNANAVRQQIRSAQAGGVVILGGYDVVPPTILDVLDPPLRRSLKDPRVDADNFIVWNDDVYADVDSDGFPELPVSRIPDGRSAALLKTAIAAPNRLKGPAWRGVRNSMRPFADSVWSNIAPGQVLLQSSPVFPTQVPALDLSGNQVYYMLHGSDADATRFWGEREDGSQLEAINLANIPTPSASVVFTGCCWGALAADGIASTSDPASPPPPRTPANSIALRYLQGGATAFVGCTGSHYSPDPPGGFFGGPMHLSFWKYLNAGKRPAEALLLAKNDYRQAMPHGVTEPDARAIEKKILWQYTCLGLGW